VFQPGEVVPSSPALCCILPTSEVHFLSENMVPDSLAATDSNGHIIKMKE
jgi:hypothetical protein